MLGRNHLLTGFSVFAAGASALDTLNKTCAPGSFGKNFCDGFLLIENRIIPGNIAASAVVGLGLYLIGTLLPDIDSEKSLLGRFVHLPFEHRTLTHSIWVPVVLFALGFLWAGFWWLGAGYLVHLLFDSASRAGICWFWPISDYRTCANGGRIKNRHNFWLYRTGKVSEYVLTILVIFLCAAPIVFKACPDIVQRIQGLFPG